MAASIIAIMLGRLRMSVEDCRTAYEKLSKQAFTPLKSKMNVLANLGVFWSAGPTFNVVELERAIISVIEENLEKNLEDNERDPTAALLLKPAPADDLMSTGKVYVIPPAEEPTTNLPRLFYSFVACTHEESKDLATFRSYQHLTAPRTAVGNQCRIWEACRATAAAPKFFPPIKIGQQKYLDGALVYNNPVQLVLKEAKDLWKDDIPLLISIGTGDAPKTGFGNNMIAVVKSLKEIAVETEKPPTYSSKVKEEIWQTMGDIIGSMFQTSGRLGSRNGGEPQSYRHLPKLT